MMATAKIKCPRCGEDVYISKCDLYREWFFDCERLTYMSRCDCGKRYLLLNKSSNLIEWMVSYVICAEKHSFL